MNEPVTRPEERSARMRARRNVTLFLLFAIAMFFAAFFSAYVVSKGSIDYWVTFRIPNIFWVSTAIILLGSLTAHMALMAASKGRSSQIATWLMVTLGLGLAFTYTQFKGWGELYRSGYALVERLKTIQGEYGTDYTITRQGVALEKVGEEFFLPSDAGHTRPLNAEMDEFKNTASSYFYVLTASHWLHLVGGLIALVVMTVMALMQRYSPADHAGLWSGVLYWHFLAALWVIILSFLAFVH